MVASAPLGACTVSDGSVLGGTASDGTVAIAATNPQASVASSLPVGAPQVGVAGSVEQTEKRLTSANGPQPDDGERVVQLVDWDAAALAPQAPVDALAQRWREAVAQSDVPVLLPASRAALDDTRSVIAGPGWYTAQLSYDGVHVSLFGTQLAERWPVDVPDEQRVREGQPQITSSEGIPSIAFTRFGVSYSLDIECDLGPSDERCTTFDLLHETFNSLAVAGPTRGNGTDDGLHGRVDGEVAP